MKKTIILLTVALICLSIGCNKYEEGPKFSMYSAKHRIQKKWKVTSFIRDDKEEMNTMAYLGNVVFYNCNNNSYPTLEKYYGLTRLIWDIKSDKTAEVMYNFIFNKFNESASDAACKPIHDFERFDVVTYKYTWEFDKKKEHLILKDAAGNTETYEIIELKDKAMKLKLDDGSTKFQCTMEIDK